MRISDWSSDVCSSDLLLRRLPGGFELGGPVLLDLADQLRRQRHVVEFGCLLLAVLQRPGAELAGRCAAPRVGRLFVHQDDVGGGDRPRLLARRVGDDQVEEIGSASCWYIFCPFVYISFFSFSLLLYSFFFFFFFF